MNWGDFGAALAILLVFEGVLPFISPDGFKSAMLRATETPNQALRIFGLLSMSAGLALLYWVRS